MKLKDFKTGDIGTVEGVITKMEERSNKNNGAFLAITISDGELQAEGKKWNATLAGFPFKVGESVFAEIKAEMYKGGVSYIIRDVTESSTPPESFVCGAPVAPEQMFGFLMKTAEKCGVFTPVLTRILSDNKEKLLTWGGGVNIHHNIRGGLLYHTYCITKTAAYVANVYNRVPGINQGVRPLDPCLLITAAILHDIGKLWELETDQFGVSVKTSTGRLLGHPYIGAEAVGRYAREENLPEEDIMLLQHVILAHHGLKEYGAPVEPVIQEAMVLHHLDMIDACLYRFQVAEKAAAPGSLSPGPDSLGNYVYRPSWRTVQDGQ